MVPEVLQNLPVYRDGSISFIQLHTVDGIFNVLWPPPGQSPSAEGHAGEAQGREDEAHVACQALQVLPIVGGLQLDQI